MMLREALGRFGRLLEVGGAAAVTLVVVRFAVAGAMEVGSGARFLGEAPPARSGAADAAAPRAAPAGPAPRRPPPPRKPGGPRTFKSSRATLMVDASDGRAEVYLGGSLLGRTPYVGEVTCVDGSTLEVEVLPAQGVPRQHSVRCEVGGTLRIQSP